MPGRKIHSIHTARNVQELILGNRIISNNLSRIHWFYGQHGHNLVKRMLLSYILLYCFHYHLALLITDIIIFSYDEEENKWIAENQKYPDFRAVLRGSLLGPREWTVYNDSTVCSGSTSYRANLSLSFCTKDQFTCSNGYCVDIAQRWVIEIIK